jgi:membrane protein YdbS with pleckstrin-like domain
MRDYFELMLQPTDKFTVFRRVVTVLWISVLFIQIVIWLVVGLIGGFDVPWWLSTAAAGGIVVGGLHLVGRGSKEQP